MIEINNLTDFPVDKKSFSQVAKKVLSGENKETYTLSLAFVLKEEMQKLNKQYRGKDAPTDVLSFELREGDYMGEVVICPEITQEKGETLEQVFVHGILHLLGYDHEKSEQEAEIMEQKEKKYLTK